MGSVATNEPFTIQKPDSTIELSSPVMRVVDKLRHVKDIQRADFQYLQRQVSAGNTPKVTIPSPTMLHFRGGRSADFQAPCTATTTRSKRHARSCDW